MLSSIHPLGERARQQRWWLTVSAHVTGGLLGGAAVGAAAGAAGVVTGAGSLASMPARVIAAGLVAAAAFFEVIRPGARWPGPRRQVDETWLTRYRGWVYGLGFGAQLGAGVTTYVVTPVVYLVLALAALTGSTASGAAVGALFGAARTAPLLGTRRLVTPEALRRFHRRLTDLAAPARRWAIGSLGAAGVALFATGIGGA